MVAVTAQSPADKNNDKDVMKLKRHLITLASFLLLILLAASALVFWYLSVPSRLGRTGVALLGMLALASAIWVLLQQRDNIRRDERLSQLRALIDSIPDLIWIKDKETRFQVVNRQFTMAFQKPLDYFFGKTDFDLSPREQAEKYYRDDQTVMTTRDILVTEESVTGKGGQKEWAETTKSPVIDEDGFVLGTVGIARNITARKEAEQKLAFLASHDELTRLPTRRQFEHELKIKLQSLNRNSKSKQHQAALYFIDLDNFKFINDSLGHTTGDVVLKELSDRLYRHQLSLCARIGGDELVVATVGDTTASNVLLFANTLMDLLREPVDLDGTHYQITASVGIALYPEHGHDVPTLLKNADVALMQAKRSGKGQAYLYQNHFDGMAEAELAIHHDIRTGLGNGEFLLHYQPQYDILGEALVGLEALVRWQHPTDGLRGPDRFIPHAEQSFLIHHIDRWVVTDCCEQIRRWLDAGITLPRVSINVASLDLESDEFMAHLLAEIDRCQIPRGLLELELTERLFLLDSNHVRNRLMQFKNAGIPITIDDFGTGYSNLGYLVNYPIDQLKIDRLFISRLRDSREHQAITRMLVHLAQELSLDLIAEGVETEQERALLESFDCRKVQGFLFNRPMPVQDITHLLHRQVRTETP